MEKRVFCFLILVIIISFNQGCATLFASKTQTLAITSEPSGSDVYINGFKMGVTPMELGLKPDKSYMIEFRKDGFQTITRVVNSKVGAGWVVLDILGGIIPIIIDASTGAWYSLDQDAVNSVLEKRQR